MNKMKPTFLTMKIVLAVLLVASFARAQDSPQTARKVVVSVTNEAVTGTTRYRLAKLTGAPATAIIAATSDTDGVVGIVTSNAGITGQAIIQMQGQVASDFDGATTAGNYVQISSSSAGRCVDFYWYPRQGSNLRPLAPEASALIH